MNMVYTLDPIEFFNIAVRLYEKSGKHDCAMARTCINRAYYAAFLVAREKYKIKNTDVSVHKSVINECKKRYRKLGNQLEDLFMNRKDADYKLEKNLTKRDAGKAIGLATDILEYLSNN